MVNGIGTGGAGKAAIEAALRRMNERAGALQQEAPSGANTNAANAQNGDFVSVLKDGVKAVNDKVVETERLHIDVIEGRLDLHEVAAHLKESELTFEFALQVRNKLLDAYREVMRMTV